MGFLLSSTESTFPTFLSTNQLTGELLHNLWAVSSPPQPLQLSQATPRYCRSSSHSYHLIASVTGSWKNVAVSVFPSSASQCKGEENPSWGSRFFHKFNAPPKRIKQLVPAQCLMQTLQKFLQTSSASYYLPRILTVKSHEHSIISEIPRQELSRERKTWHQMHSCK